MNNNLENQLDLTAHSRTSVASKKTKQVTKEVDETTSNFPIYKIAYIFGGVVLLGLIFYLSFVWSEIDSFSRVVVTLGSGMLLVALGSVLLKQVPDKYIDTGTVFHTVGGVLIPVGIIVAEKELGVEDASFWTMTIISGFLFAFYLLLSYVHLRTIIYFFTIAHGTVFIYLFTESITHNSTHDNLYNYLNMAVGAGYLLLSFFFRNQWNGKLLDTLNLIGTVGLLGFAFTLLFASPVWQVLYIFLVSAVLYLAVRMKSLVMLIITTLAMFAYLAYLTQEYVVMEQGWTISMAVLSVTYLVLGYLAYFVGKNYIKNKG